MAGTRPMAAAGKVMLTEEEREHILKLKNDLPYFASKLLWIKTKDVKGTVKRFVFNKAQLYIHKCLEMLKKQYGNVRAIILKGRQQGSSTYVTARYYWHALINEAQNIYIMSHDTKSAGTLFGKVDFYYKRTLEQFKPKADKSNAKQLKLSNDSEYTIGTAGTEDSGRGDTIHYLHLSEAASFKDPDDVQSGIMQTVPEGEGTEIIVECTAKGMNWFYSFCMNAIAGPKQKDWNGFHLIFVPWFWEPGYTAEVPATFKMDEEERTIAKRWALTPGQMQWRRLKVAKLGEKKFKQEYPCTVVEAFQASGDPFFDAEMVQAARESLITTSRGALVLGVDPARSGDRTVICLRQGRVIKKIWKYKEMDEMRLAGILAKLIDRYDIDKCFIDYGSGYGTVDRLRELKYGSIVTGINFGSKSSDSLYLNKRAEMYHNLRDWLNDGDVTIPDDDDVALDLAAIPEAEETSSGKLKMKDKKLIKKEYGRSPDIADAIALTFAMPVRSKHLITNSRRTANTKQGSSITTLRQFRTGRSGLRRAA